MAMTVKELINELLECDMNTTVEVEVYLSNGEEQTSDVDVVRTYSFGGGVKLQIDISDKASLNEGDE